MKPFNLERALAGDPVVTRAGRKIIEIIAFKSNVPFPIFCVIEKEIESGFYIFKIDGSYFSNSQNDLFMAPIKKSGWINIYKKNIDSFDCGTIHISKEEALSFVDTLRKSYITTIQIEWEE